MLETGRKPSRARSPSCSATGPRRSTVRVPLGEGRFVIPILQRIRQDLTTIIERGVDISTEAAQDIDQAIRACEEKTKVA